MAGFVSGIIPTYKVGQKHRLIVFGCGFVEGDTPIDVKLVNTQNEFAWEVEKVILLDSTKIEVLVRLVKPGPLDPGGGVGDLTTTVTNGDGNTTPPSSVQVNYEVSPFGGD